MASELVQQEEAGGALVGGPTGLFMQLPHHRLLDAIRLFPVCIELVDLLKRMKLTNWCLCMVVRQEMRANHTYRDAVMGVFVISGTKIPCGAETVLDLPTPADEQSLMQVFNESGTVVQENGVQVGGAYGFSLLEDRTFYDCFEEEAGNSIYLGIKIEFGPQDFFQPPNVPLLANNMADLRKVPNIFRRVLDMPALTHNYTEITDTADYITSYMRLVRLSAHHTILDIQNAIADVEGWPRRLQCSMNLANGDEYAGTDNVFEECAMARETDEIMRPMLWFALGDQSEPLD